MIRCGMTDDHRGPSAGRLLITFLRTRGSSEEFAVGLANRAIAQLPGDVRGRFVLDLGCGPGSYSAALERHGACVVSTDFDISELRRYGSTARRAAVADGRQMPFADATFDAIVCSNVLEHTPQPFEVLAEIERLLVPGGWAYVSWTNWLSPWGGHAVAPLHYLGPARSVRVWRRLFGEPKGSNLPNDGVWPTYIGRTQRWLRTRPGLRLDRAFPRYWPWMRWVLWVPGLREVVTWNCVLHITRTHEDQLTNQ